MAWLNATPKPPPGSKRAKRHDGAPQLSRIERLKRDKITPVMPPNPAPHIISRLIEVGLSEAVGMGVGPVSWSAIVAWQAAVGTNLPPWEARLLRQLSIEYVAEGRRAESETCPPPWHAAVTQREIDTEKDRLAAALG